jgi:hypothetical protein
MAKTGFRWAWAGACLLGACASGAAADRSMGTSQAASAQGASQAASAQGTSQAESAQGTSQAVSAQGASPQASAQASTRAAGSGAAGAERGAPGESTTGTIVGRAELERGNELWIGGSEDEGRAFEPLKVDDRTAVTIDGQKATMAQVNAGDEVRASYSGSPSALHVDRLEVRTPEASQQGQR